MISGENQGIAVGRTWNLGELEVEGIRHGDSSRGKIHCDNGLVFGKPNPNQLPLFFLYGATRRWIWLLPLSIQSKPPKRYPMHITETKIYKSRAPVPNQSAVFYTTLFHSDSTPRSHPPPPIFIYL